MRASTLSNGDILILAQPLGDTESTLHRLLLVELVVTGGRRAGGARSAASGWSGSASVRLRDMETAAESIAAGNLTERVPGENEKTEVGRLARTLNVMLTRIESAFAARVASEQRLRESDARLRRFVADASHELRTPIAAVPAYAELFGRGASEQKEDLERLMRGIQSPRPDGWSTWSPTCCSWPGWTRADPWRRSRSTWWRCVPRPSRRRGPSGRRGRCTFTATRPIEVVGDATSLRQVIDNLLGNVRSHTPEGTTAPTCRSSRDGQRCRDRGGRRRPGDGARSGGPRLRAVLPVRPQPLPPARRRRARPVHRVGHRRRPRGNGGGQQPSGQGTTFTVRLPALPPDGPPDGTQAESGSPSRRHPAPRSSGRSAPLVVSRPAPPARTVPAAVPVADVAECERAHRGSRIHSDGTADSQLPGWAPRTVSP